VEPPHQTHGCQNDLTPAARPLLPEASEGLINSCPFIGAGKYLILPSFLYHPSSRIIALIRSQRAIRRSRQASLKGEGLGKITNAISIRERPASVEDRAVPGHWEGDLIFGTHNSQIATLVERHTRYVMLAKVNGKDTETVINALIKQAHKLPSELCKSLTWDRGSEMADHRRFTLATDIEV